MTQTLLNILSILQICYVTGPLVVLLMFIVMIYGYAVLPESAYAVGAIFDRGNGAKKLLAYRTGVRSVESSMDSLMSLGNSLVSNLYVFSLLKVLVDSIPSIFIIAIQSPILNLGLMFYLF
jgi:hypothetical protein